MSSLQVKSVQLEEHAPFMGGTLYLKEPSSLRAVAQSVETGLNRDTQRYCMTGPLISEDFGELSYHFQRLEDMLPQFVVSAQVSVRVRSAQRKYSGLRIKAVVSSPPCSVFTFANGGLSSQEYSSLLFYLQNQ